MKKLREKNCKLFKNMYIIYKLNYVVFKYVSGILQRTDLDQRKNLNKQVCFFKLRGFARFYFSKN